MPATAAAASPPSKLFIPHPIQIYNDLETGDISSTAFCCYSLMLKQVNYETGIWRGSAEKIRVACNGGMAERTIQRAIQELEEAKYIRDFRRQGERGNKPIALHGYSVRFGPHKGQRLNALSTIDPHTPVYEPDPCQDPCSNE